MLLHIQVNLTRIQIKLYIITFLGIIIEYMDRGSLEFMLEENLEVSEPVLAAIVYQVLWGLGYLHFDNRMVNQFTWISFIYFYQMLSNFIDCIWICRR